MAKTKALKLEKNDELRETLRSLIGKARPFGTRSAAAKRFGVSGAYISDFLNGYRGAGTELLRGIAPFRPLVVLRALDIDPRAIVALWRESDEGVEGGEGLTELPDALRRATVAAVELLQCTADEAIKVASALADEHRGRGDEDPDWWLLQIRDRVPKRRGSGVRKRRTSSGI